MRNQALRQCSLELFHPGVGNAGADAKHVSEPCHLTKMVQARIADPGPREPDQGEGLHPLQVEDARIIDLRVGEEQPPQSGQVLDVGQPHTRDSRSSKVKLLEMSEPSEMNKVAVADPPFAKVDGDDLPLVVK